MSESPTRATDEQRVRVSKRKPLRCRLGMHREVTQSGTSLTDSIRVCDDCGTWWEATFDGINAGWRKIGPRR